MKKNIQYATKNFDQMGWEFIYFEHISGMNQQTLFQTLVTSSTRFIELNFSLIILIILIMQ